METNEVGSVKTELEKRGLLATLKAKLKGFVYDLDTLTVGMALLGVLTVSFPIAMGIVWFAGAWVWQAKLWNQGAAVLAGAYSKMGQDRAARGILDWAQWMSEKRDKE